MKNGLLTAKDAKNICKNSTYYNYQVQIVLDCIKHQAEKKEYILVYTDILHRTALYDSDIRYLESLGYRIRNLNVGVFEIRWD